MIMDDPEFFTVEQLKEVNLWPYTFLSAYGMLPYIKRMRSEEVIGAEVGVLKGENVYTLLTECPKISKIYGIDHYEAHTDYDNDRTKEDMEKYEKIAEKNLKSFGDRYELIREKSKKAAYKIKKESLDFVLIDGDHTYEGIKADLKSYYSLLKSGGYMFVHDYNVKSVMDAIKSFKNEQKIRIPLNMSKNFVCFWIKP